MSPSTDEVERLIDRWDEERENGNSIAIEDLTDDPELREALRVQIDRLKAMSWLDDGRETVDLATQAIDTPSKSMEGLDGCVPWMLGNRYVLNSLIAGGGFGQVWRAWDRRLERPIAVKVSRVDNSVEAKNVARLQHKNIITVHDLGTEGDLWFIVFDLIEGTDLDRWLKTDPPHWREAVRVVAEVAETLAYAHDKGFVHRDIKPANILLNSVDGTTVLADFGIAVTDADLNSETATTAGTLAYMAPELLVGDGKHADVCTDVYGLGVVLYQLLTQELPYIGRNFCEVRKRVLSGEPPQWPETVAAIPASLREVTERCIAKDPDVRYQSADELARVLRTIIKPPCPEEFARLARLAAERKA